MAATTQLHETDRTGTGWTFHLHEHSTQPPTYHLPPSCPQLFPTGFPSPYPPATSHALDSPDGPPPPDHHHMPHTYLPSAPGTDTLLYLPASLPACNYLPTTPTHPTCLPACPYPRQDKHPRPGCSSKACIVVATTYQDWDIITVPITHRRLVVLRTLGQEKTYATTCHLLPGLVSATLDTYLPWDYLTDGFITCHRDNYSNLPGTACRQGHGACLPACLPLPAHTTMPNHLPAISASLLPDGLPGYLQSGTCLGMPLCLAGTCSLPAMPVHGPTFAVLLPLPTTLAFHLPLAACTCLTHACRRTCMTRLPCLRAWGHAQFLPYLGRPDFLPYPLPSLLPTYTPHPMVTTHQHPTCACWTD